MIELKVNPNTNINIKWEIIYNLQIGNINKIKVHIN